MRRARRFGARIALLSSWISAGCDNPVDVPSPVEVVEIRRYGTLEATEAASGGAALSRVVGIVQAPDSTVYVLDQEWRKIVAFDPAGAVRDVLAIPRGDGPGEAQVLRDLALDPDGDLAVLDWQLSRVTLLDRSDGGTLGTIALEHPAPLRMALDEEAIWIARHVPPGSTAERIMRLARSGRRVEGLAPLAPDDREFGGGVEFARDRVGRLLLARVTPGVWDRVGDDGVVETLGEVLFDDIAPPQVIPEGVGIRIVDPAATTIGIAAWGDESVLIAYRTRSVEGTDPLRPAGDWAYGIALFTGEGELLGRTELAEAPSELYVSPVTNHVFWFVREPFPMVKEVRLVMR